MYWLTGILGLGFAIAPYLLGYSDNTSAFWTSMILGGSVILLSVIEGYSDDKDHWEYAVAALVGISAIAAPFLLGFSGIASALWTSLAVGALLAITAGSKFYFDRTSFG